LIKYYDQKNMTDKINGLGDIGDIYGRIKSVLDKY